MSAFDSGTEYFLIPSLAPPLGCVPERVDALLCPTARDGYSSRLFFSQMVAGRGNPNWNRRNERILERNWFAFSFKVPAGLRLAQLVASHMKGLELMKIFMRMHQSLYSATKADLQRPHPHAAERIGFLFARSAPLDSGDQIILFTEYVPVRDEHYIYDKNVGARISGDAIRQAMEHVLQTGQSAIHLHLHRDGLPLGFSESDVEGYLGLIPSLKRVGAHQPHGAMVLNSDGAYAAIWMPGCTSPVIAKDLCVVGFPLHVFGCNDE